MHVPGILAQPVVGLSGSQPPEIAYSPDGCWHQEVGTAGLHFPIPCQQGNAIACKVPCALLLYTMSMQADRGVPGTHCLLARQPAVTVVPLLPPQPTSITLHAIPCNDEGTGLPV